PPPGPDEVRCSSERVCTSRGALTPELLSSETARPRPLPGVPKPKSRVSARSSHSDTGYGRGVANWNGNLHTFGLMRTAARVCVGYRWGYPAQSKSGRLARSRTCDRLGIRPGPSANTWVLMRGDMRLVQRRGVHNRVRQQHWARRTPAR